MNLAFHLLSNFLVLPRAATWLLFALLALVGLMQAGRLTGRVIAGAHALALVSFVLGHLASHVIDGLRREYSSDFNWWQLLAQVGAVSLVFLILCYLDAERREHVRGTWMLEEGAADPAKAAVVVLLAALACFPIARSFTGPVQFGVQGMLSACEKHDMCVSAAFGDNLSYDVPYLDYDQREALLASC